MTREELERIVIEFMDSFTTMNLSCSVEDTPWAHIDMAGTDDSDKDKGVWVKGSTGIPTRTLANLVLSLAAKG